MNDLEEMKRESEKIKVEDQGVQTDFPVSSHNVNAATAAEALKSEMGCRYDV